MQALSVSCFAVVCLVFLAVLYGMLRQENKQQKEDLQTGEKIDKIISNNSSITDNEWDSWLQERSNKQK